MVAEYYPDRIWFYPQKFWAATRNMDKQQADELRQRIQHMAEERDLDGLRQFDFIYIGNPYRKAS